MKQKVKNTPFADALKDWKTPLQEEEELLLKMKAVVETPKPFVDGEHISRQRYKDQKEKVERMRKEVEK